MILQMVKVTENKKYMLLEYKLSHSVNKAYSFGILFHISSNIDCLYVPMRFQIERLVVLCTERQLV